MLDEDNKFVLVLQIVVKIMEVKDQRMQLQRKKETGVIDSSISQWITHLHDMETTYV